MAHVKQHLKNNSGIIKSRSTNNNRHKKATGVDNLAGWFLKDVQIHLVHL